MRGEGDEMSEGEDKREGEGDEGEVRPCICCWE